MFTDLPHMPGGEPPEFPICASCKSVIEDLKSVVRLDPDWDPNVDPVQVESKKRSYHPQCAHPIESLQRALESLSRRFN